MTVWSLHSKSHEDSTSRFLTINKLDSRILSGHTHLVSVNPIMLKHFVTCIDRYKDTKLQWIYNTKVFTMILRELRPLACHCPISFPVYTGTHSETPSKKMRQKLLVPKRHCFVCSSMKLLLQDCSDSFNDNLMD